MQKHTEGAKNMIADAIIQSWRSFIGVGGYASAKKHHVRLSRLQGAPTSVHIKTPEANDRSRGLY